jgi:hypothetical protein
MNAPAPLSCPRCSAPVDRPGPQTCPRCGRAFTLYVGPALDPTLTASPSGPKLQVKSPGFFLMRYGVLDERGIAEGNLDPIIGHLPIDTQGIAWHDIASIAVHRAPAWTDLIVAVLVPLPITIGLGLLAIEAPFAGVFAAIFALIAGFLIWRGYGVQACRARVIGRYRTIDVRFDRPFWRRQAFHDELVRRAGGSPGPMP